MRYCSDCGTGHDCTGQATAGPSDAVRIAEIERDMEIQLAKIERSVMRDESETALEVAEISAAVDIETSAGEAEIVGAALEGGQQEPPEPTIIDAPQAIADEPPADAPPEVEGSAPPEPKHKAAGIGFW